MHFALPCPSRIERVLVSLAASHGLVDARLPLHRLAVYMLVLFARHPLPDAVGYLVNACFAIASLAHFANDIGWMGSLLLHAGLVGVAQRSTRTATSCLSLYMAVVHIPLAVAPVAPVALVAVALGWVVFWCLFAFEMRETGEFELSHSIQVLVVCHVMIQL